MSEEATLKVWDIQTRIFHWSLVLFFVITFASGEEFETVHLYAGYVIIALLAFRLVWGFIGNRYARFSDFIYSPAEIKHYLVSIWGPHPKNYSGHNPAGGAMVIMLLLFLSLSSWSGLKAYEPPQAAAEVSMIAAAQAESRFEEHERGAHRGDKFWQEAHEVLVNFTLLLVFVHITGVFMSSEAHNENLVRSMITGRKRRRD